MESFTVSIKTKDGKKHQVNTSWSVIDPVEYFENKTIGPLEHEVVDLSFEYIKAFIKINGIQLTNIKSINFKEVSS